MPWDLIKFDPEAHSERSPTLAKDIHSIVFEKIMRGSEWRLTLLVFIIGVLICSGVPSKLVIPSGLPNEQSFLSLVSRQLEFSAFNVSLSFFNNSKVFKAFCISNLDADRSATNLSTVALSMVNSFSSFLTLVA